MTQELHHSTVELSNSKLQLRPDLSFSLQQYQSKPCYVIEDDLNSKFFRVGIPEYNFISLLDGHTTVAHAIAQTAAQMGDQAITEQEAITICNWLIQSNLASTEVSRSAGRLHESFKEANQRKQMAAMNPVTPRIPLFNPDRFLSAITPVFGWLFSFPMMFVWFATVATGGYHIWINWDAVTSNASTVFSNNNWIYLGLTWIGLKVVHEMAHGIVCKKFGGTVRQAGLVMIVLIPLPFVDVTSIWKFYNKWHRIYVAAAGMYTEVFLAAVAAIFWAHMGPGVTKQVLFNVILAGSFTTVLFNANPLMRFDGYYMLTDWMELPNLGSHGNQWMKWLGKKFYLGQDVKQPTWPEGHKATIALYAISAFAWRILICVALILAAESLLFGLGITLAFFAFMAWVVWPIGKLLKYVFIGEETQQRPSRTRFVLVTTCLCAAIWAFFAYTPWHSRIEAPAVVDFQQISEVRTPVGGFVRQIMVEPGQKVSKNQILVRLENKELMSEVEQLKSEIEVARLRARKFKKQDEITAYQVETNNEISLYKRLEERTSQLAELEVRAPQEGILIADDLRSLTGAYISAGHQLCSIGTGASKEVHALVAQNEYEAFQLREGEDVDVHIWGFGTGHIKGKLNQVVPRAKVQLPHPAFSSTSGGPLPVRYKPATESRSEDQNDVQLELVEPRFFARVQLNENNSNMFRPGQLGMISFRTSTGTVGSVTYDYLYRWFTKASSATIQ